MKFRKPLIIIGSILFFLTALTFYINKVVFPQLIKKIAIVQIQANLKRHVEIGSIHFNWVRGIIIDKIKVYDKDSQDAVFLQADQVSFGIIIIPGFKHYRITIPFINVHSPSIHLVRTSENTWNFSDLYTPASNATPSLPTPTPSSSASKPSSVEFAWGGITITNGKFLVEDKSKAQAWSEFFDNINLKLSLSYKGIKYDFTADIPAKKGFIGANVNYQPMSKDTQAKIHLKNIDTASYLSLVNIPDLHLTSGIIQEINLDIIHTQEKTSAQGDVLMKDINITRQDQSFKGNIAMRNLNALYQNGDITAQGQIALNHIQTQIIGFTGAGSVETTVNEFNYNKEGVTFVGSLQAQNILVDLKDRKVKVHQVNLDNIHVRQDKDGLQSVGSIITQGLSVQWPHQDFQGDVSLKAVTMRMKDENAITLDGDLEANNISTSMDDKKITAAHLLFENAQVNIKDQKNIALTTKLSVDDLSLSLGENLSVSTSIKTNQLSLNLEDDVLKISTSFNTQDGKVVLDHHKTIDANPQLELNMEIPLNDPQAMNYKGSITLSDASIHGFVPFETLDNVSLDLDFQNDAAVINALSVNVLDTNINITGTVKDFKKPHLNIVAEADELNLSQIKDLIPQIVNDYGLNLDGVSNVKVQFDGLASDPLAGKILAVASFKHINASSSKWHQNLSNITGIIEATPDSLKWRDFTATYLGKKYRLAGSLVNFKNPKIITTLSGPNLELKGELQKEDNLVMIHTLSGTYLDTSFKSQGTITLLPGQQASFNLSSSTSLLLENMINYLPADQQEAIKPLHPTGTINMQANLKGTGMNWKNYTINAAISSPLITLLDYKLNNMNISINQDKGKVKNLTFDGKLYDGTVHAVGSLDLLSPKMPFDLAFNIDNTDMHQLKMDSPLKMEEIDGKLFLTTMAHGTIADFKNNLSATGSFAVRDGFLAEFNIFKGLLSILNDAMRLGQVEITDIESNFTIENQKINTDNLRLKGPTVVLLGKGWVDFDQMCDLDMKVDLSSGVIPDIAHDVLKSLDIRIYDKIANPKFKKKISVPQVINTLLKNLLQ